VTALIGVFAGLATAQDPTATEGPQATAREVDCSSMPDMSDAEARELRGCYVTELDSAPAAATEQEIAEAKAAALCGAISDPAEVPEVCANFASDGAGDSTGATP
jgi:hypothetical protein